MEINFLEKWKIIPNMRLLDQYPSYIYRWSDFNWRFKWFSV